jgi:methyl-accepting chemotaxis protein
MMVRSWSFGRIVAAGLFIIAALTSLCCGVSIYGLRSVVAAKDSVITESASRRLAVESLRLMREQRTRAAQRYLISPSDAYLRSLRVMQAQAQAGIEAFRSAGLSAEERRLFERLEEANADLLESLEQIVALRQGGAPMGQVVEAYDRLVNTRVKPLDDALSALADHEASLHEEAKRASSDSASRVSAVVGGIAALAALLAGVLAVLIRRFLTEHVRAVIQDVQGSSTELGVGAKEQVESAERLAMVTAEIATTISELLAASRQIAESAQRVTHAAEETAQGASAGDETVQRTQDAIVGIKRQVDLIVSHMLDLDRKFQEIGAILDLIREFAEQTNILSINATIEAAGAGAAGKRFAVVADEIQRLADRVGGSTREIYQLIDEIREAANATMLATEDGKRAVDSGARHFHDVLTTFKEIATRSSVTSEAAREIELSTKQQTTAVEQVSLAIGSLGRAAREAQLRSSRTLTTSEQLSGISRRLTQLIRAETKA